MSETTTARTGPAPPPDCPLQPAEILINVIVNLLAPMFLIAAGGDIVCARTAAAETLDSYRSGSLADLIIIAKIIAFGLAALASLGLSMDDDLPIPMIIRLRANAAACDRAEHRNHRTLQQSPPERSTEPDRPAPPPAQPKTQKQAAEDPVPQAPPANEERHQAMWAAAAARIAAETAANLEDLSPEARQSASIWIDVLNDAAREFQAGSAAPRPRPGDAAWTHRPSGT
jgi:hypothetical protein